MDGQKFCLKWDGFQSSVLSLFDCLREDGELVDITLCCEGQRVKAHRMMLSACSPYFRDILKNNPCQQMVIFLRDTSAADLSAIIEFMYKGCVNVTQTQLASFIKTAEMLQIKGLSGDDDKRAESPPARRRGSARPASPPTKRRRTSLPAPALSEPALSEREREPEPALCERRGAAPGGGAQSPAAAPGAHQPVKMEKVDLTDDDQDMAAGSNSVSLDAALGYGAEYDGHEPPDLSLAGDPLAGLAGPSQSLSEEGSAQGSLGWHRCGVCSRVFLSAASLYNHKKQHQGRTHCPLCGVVYSTVPTLRRHLLMRHGVSAEEMYRLVPTEIRVRRPAHAPASGGVPAPSSSGRRPEDSGDAASPSAARDPAPAWRSVAPESPAGGPAPVTEHHSAQTSAQSR